MKLRFIDTDNGNCRVYVRDEAQRLLCFQLQDYRAKTFDLYRCSKDGEPSHTIAHDAATLDQEPEPYSTTAREFVEWWRAQATARHRYDTAAGLAAAAAAPERFSVVATGDANFYRIVRGDRWIAAVQLNGEFLPDAQEAIMRRFAATLDEHADLVPPRS